MKMNAVNDREGMKMAMNNVLDRIPEEQIEAAKRVDLVALAERYTELRRESAREFSGPCPHCGGDDRFHCTAQWFFCRTCHRERGDAIEFVRWLQPGLSFREAVDQLAGGAWPTAPAAQRAPQRRAAAKSQPEEWRQKAERIAEGAHRRLWAAEGEPAREYLLGRGLESHVWLLYGLGYRPDAPLPGTKGEQRAPAIVLPWRSQAGAVYALRYRFLEAQHYIDAGGKQRTEKLVAETGSQFAGKLFGGQTLPDFVVMPLSEGQRPAEQMRTLLLCEGEINAMSCWQAAGETRLDVLSLGSESATITPAMATLAGRYGLALVWADREEVAQRLMAALPGAVGIQSPNGKDANDLLKEGLLGGFLAAMRANHAKSREEIEALLWNLYDAAMLPLGIDASSAMILRRLAGQLGREAKIYEPEPGRWITVA